MRPTHISLSDGTEAEVQTRNHVVVTFLLSEDGPFYTLPTVSFDRKFTALLTEDEAFRLASLYDIDDDLDFAQDDYDDYVEDEDGSEAYARMLERRAEAGSWFGREGY